MRRAFGWLDCAAHGGQTSGGGATMTTNAWASSVLLIVACFVSACAAPQSGSCTRDPELIAEQRDCRDDDDCPCGTSCVLGVCDAECTTSAECAVGWCDDFGRCRGAADTARIGAVRLPTASVLRVLGADVRLTEAMIARPVEVVAGTDVEETRVTGSDGVEVSCDDGATYGDECRVGALPSGSRSRILIRTATMDVPTGSVRFFHGDDVETIGVTTDPIGDEPAPQSDVLTSGAYRGVLELVSLGVAEDVRPASNRVEVTAHVYATGATTVLELRDPQHGLTESGAWIGTIASAGASHTLDLTTVSYAHEAHWPGSEIEILASVEPSELHVTSTSIAGALQVDFLGVTHGGRAPHADWQLVLARTGDLPDGSFPPSVPADAVLATSTANRALESTPWEAAARTAIGHVAVGGIGLDARRALIDAFGPDVADVSLSACTLDSADMALLGPQVLSDAWGASSDAAAPTSLDSEGLRARLAGAFLVTGASASIEVVLDASDFRPTELPCQVRFAATDAGSTCAPGARYRLGTIDLCEEMAASYGCSVEAAPAGRTMDLSASASLAGACTETSAATVPGEVLKTCRLPARPDGCVVGTLCHDGSASLDAPALGTGSLAGSGDLHCAVGGDLFPLDAMFERAPCPPSSPVCDRLGAQGVIDECAADLSRALTEAPASQLDRVFDTSASCLDVARMLVALGFATDGARARSVSSGAGDAVLGARVGHRILQRLLDQATFATREAAQRELLAEMFRQPGSGTAIPTAEESLEATAPVLDLLLHPRWATALDRLEPIVLTEPDYRPYAGAAIAADPSHRQTDGVSLSMLSYVDAAFDLLLARLEWAALQHDTSIVEPAGELFRETLVVRALAASMRARVGDGATWSGAHVDLEREVTAAIDDAMTRSRAIVLGRNPLGIEDDDLPLYFFGDEATPTTRFSAISDFLIGAMPGSVISGSAWAPALVQLARDGWDDAMPLFVERLDRDVQVRMSDAELEAELDSIRLDFGQRLGNICYPDDVATVDFLEQWRFNERSCFYRSTASECALPDLDLADLVTQSQLAYQFCLVREARARAGDFVSFGDVALDRITSSFESCSDVQYPVVCPPSIDGAHCISCDLGSETIVAALEVQNFRSVFGVRSVPDRTRQDATNACLAAHPDADTSLPAITDQPNSPTALRGCYNGALGEAVFELLSATREVEVAQSEYAEAQDRYDIAVRSCAASRAGADRLEAALTQHNETIRTLSIARAVMDGLANVAQATGECMGNMDLEDAVFGGVGCAANYTEAALRTVITGLDTAMEDAQRQHDALVQMIEADTEWEVCMNDASMELVSQRTLALRVEQALVDVEARFNAIHELQVAARTIYDDGRSALERARARHVAPLTHDLWLSTQVTRFWRDMRLARRVTYLAVRAVEYENQESLSLRDTVLRARTPDELWAVLSDLWRVAGTRSVDGSRPTELKVVVSLRDQLLQLAEGNETAGELGLSQTERFRLLLTSSRYAAFDAAGTYVGQRIPFELVPFGTLGLGEAGGIPVLAGSDCAERLWSVNASVIGADLYRGSAPSFVRIDLEKSNTFYSQWCGAAPSEAQPFQIASVRPSVNLFRDPSFGTGLTMPFGSAERDEGATRARIEAYFNVDRVELEHDDYANGSTSELAARGLYGEYALFIPSDVMSSEGSDGLRLENVDDILLRFDYVSVAQ